MGSNLYKRIAVPLVLALAIGPASALATPNLMKDYSKNGATGDYAPAKVYKDYSKNGATGDFTPAVHHPVTVVPVVRTVRTAQSSRGFAWSDAGAGAGVMLAIVLVAGLTARQVRRRRIPAPAPARPAV